MKTNIQVGDKVELLRDELFDDQYYDSKRTTVSKGTIMKVVAISPKVHMISGDGHDGKPYFLNLEMLNNNSHSRVRTNFCNVKRIA